MMATTEPDIQSSLADMAVRIAAWGDARGVAIDPAGLEKVRTGEMDAVEVMAIMTKIGMIFDPSVFTAESDNRRSLALDTKNLTVIVHQREPKGAPQIDMPCNFPEDSAEMREFARMLFLAADAYDHLKSQATPLPA
jgi:hypothetical protein